MLAHLRRYARFLSVAGSRGGSSMGTVPQSFVSCVISQHVGDEAALREAFGESNRRFPIPRQPMSTLAAPPAARMPSNAKNGLKVPARCGSLLPRIKKSQQMSGAGCQATGAAPSPNSFDACSAQTEPFVRCILSTAGPSDHYYF